MPTKEEILNKLQKENPHSIPTFKAMDEYAKQQAIEFMKFVDAFYSQQVSSTEYDKMYSQFIEQQTKE